MCESAAYLITDKGEQKIMENVVYMKPENGKVYLADLLGEQKIVEGIVKEIKLIEHKIIIAEK
ncbi:CooT family nickel-binding protein [Clostridium formicaceticum]|uniref:RNA-binding protein n=1 Tax=Clostridium formicaceticum TaxID=1497 RepID=A0AAC9RKR4_9CLOT|nr:CooT family nickel-binding protein [Clostridium formicaceticum]AOY76419.1 RNA-binding protein [Clostridium formicaceticum]ARE86813.1 putative RNA-binding protein [Clostridium formicaceticum]